MRTDDALNTDDSSFLVSLNRFQSCYIYSRSDPFLMRPFRPRFLHFPVFGFLRVWQPAATDRPMCPMAVFHVVGLQMQTSSGRISRRGSVVLQLGCKCRRRQADSAVLQLGCKCRRRQAGSLGVAALCCSWVANADAVSRISRCGSG